MASNLMNMKNNSQRNQSQTFAQVQRQRGILVACTDAQTRHPARLQSELWALSSPYWWHLEAFSRQQNFFNHGVKTIEREGGSREMQINLKGFFFFKTQPLRSSTMGCLWTDRKPKRSYRFAQHIKQAGAQLKCPPCCTFNSHESQVLNKAIQTPSACPEGVFENHIPPINKESATLTGRLWKGEPLQLPLIVALTALFFFFNCFVPFILGAARSNLPREGPTVEVRHVVSLLAGSQRRRRCQPARRGDLSSYFNMFVSCMQILRHRASVVSQILPASTRTNTHTHTRSYTQTQLYCVISPERLSQIRGKKGKKVMCLK